MVPKTASIRLSSNYPISYKNNSQNKSLLRSKEKETMPTFKQASSPHLISAFPCIDHHGPAFSLLRLIVPFLVSVTAKLNAGVAQKKQWNTAFPCDFCRSNTSQDPFSPSRPSFAPAAFSATAARHSPKANKNPHPHLSIPAHNVTIVD